LALRKGVEEIQNEFARKFPQNMRRHIPARALMSFCPRPSLNRASQQEDRGANKQQIKHSARAN